MAQVNATKRDYSNDGSVVAELPRQIDVHVAVNSSGVEKGLMNVVKAGDALNAKPVAENSNVA